MSRQTTPPQQVDSRSTLAILCLLCLVFVQVDARAQQHPGPGEWGDAPEGAPAYPALGVAGGFPTCFGGPAGFVFHANMAPVAWFGLSMDSEPDGNAGFCPSPPYEMDECWGAADGDGGLVNTSTFTIFQNNIQQCSSGPYDPVAPACAVVQWGAAIDLMVSNLSGNVAMINVLFDWNHDGRWNGQVLCPGTGPVREHAIANLPVPDGYIGFLSGLSPGPLEVGPNDGPVWARFTIGDPLPVPPDWDGSFMYDTGETEDYLLAIGLPGGGGDAGELGDAPEDELAYPNGTVGHFPTCIAGGAIGYVYHRAPITAFFGPLVDLEAEGNHDLCNFSLQNHDECDQDGDAGLIVPRAYDLVNGTLSACPQQGGAPSLPGACQRVTWGADIDITIDNSGGPDMLLHVLADWDRSGDWGQTVTCASGDVGGEQIVINQAVPAGFSGPASLLGLPSFRALSSDGPVWFRFTLSDAAVSPDWTGDGQFGDGETEDYLLFVGAPTSVPAVGAGLGLRLLPAQPNPFNPRTTIRCELEIAGDLRVTVHDARGRLVRTLAVGTRGVGAYDFVWDGTDDGGRRVESGVYLVRADAGHGATTQKVALFK
ncbi:MAG: hypothetical protein IPJ24_03890 [bacterium]|nr:hypothetical protein [bacterium]